MVVERLEICVDSDTFYSALNRCAVELGAQINEKEISHNNTKYRIEEHHESDHEFGEGGHSSGFDRIVKQDTGQIVLECKRYVDWMTTSDDYFDYTGKTEYSLTLFSKDSIARAVFNEIKRLKTLSKWHKKDFF